MPRAPYQSHVNFISQCENHGPHFLTNCLAGWKKSFVLFTVQELFSSRDIFEAYVLKEFFGHYVLNPMPYNLKTPGIFLVRS